MIPDLAYLVLGKQCVADSSQQHHRDQERDEAFGRHDGGYAAGGEYRLRCDATARDAGTHHSPSSRVRGDQGELRQAMQGQVLAVSRSSTCSCQVRYELTRR